MVSITINRNHFNSFMKGFGSMDDIVLHADEDAQRIHASGTADRAFFITRWSGAEVTEGGSFAVGQLGTLLSLVRDLPQNEEGTLSLQFDGDNLTISSGSGFFRIPTLATATSSAGVEQLSGTLQASAEGGYEQFGPSPFEYAYTFEAQTFRQLQKVGSAISNGALFSLICDGTGVLTYAVLRDGIRVEHEIDATTFADDYPEGENVIWFGAWLLDALKAMPSAGAVHLSCGADTPLLLRHEALEGQQTGTTVIVAPRQEAEGNA